METPAQTNWLELPLKRISQILVFSPQAAPPHRIRVRGVVTGCQPGQSVYLRDGPDLLNVETSQPTDYLPGDFINVTGFPAMSPYSAELRHAVCQQVAAGSCAAGKATAGRSAGRIARRGLIRLRAKLLDSVVDDNGITLALHS